MALGDGLGEAVTMHSERLVVSENLVFFDELGVYCNID